jgi:hypothetical protein
LFTIVVLKVSHRLAIDECSALTLIKQPDSRSGYPANGELILGARLQFFQESFGIGPRDG